MVRWSNLWRLKEGMGGLLRGGMCGGQWGNEWKLIKNAEKWRDGQIGLMDMGFRIDKVVLDR